MGLSPLLCAFAIIFVTCAQASPLQKYVIFNISNFGEERVDVLKHSLSSDSKWWIELGDKLLAEVDISNYVIDPQLGEILDVDVDETPIFIVHKLNKYEVDETLKSSTLIHGFGILVVKSSAEEVERVFAHGEGISPQKKIVSFNYINTVLVKKSSPVRSAPSPGNSTVPISTLINQVSESRWFSDVKTLASYNRYTKGPTIVNAEDWIIQQLELLPNIAITTQYFQSGTTSGYNVIGTLTGSLRPNSWVIIGGHYDSTSQSPTTAAPGAEDDASGAAAVLEMARILHQYPPDATAIFIFFSGEEQGLYGSKQNAKSIVDSGNKNKVQLMHNMDMIAYQRPGSAKYQCLLETDKQFEVLFKIYLESGNRYTDLELFQSTTAWGSDHEPYLNLGMPALLTIDYDWDSYPQYHRTTDTPNYLTPRLGYEIIKLGLGAVAQVLGYPF